MNSDNFALYVGGRRITNVTRVSFCSEQAELKKDERLGPAKAVFEFKVNFQERDLDRFWSFVESICPESDRRRRAAAYRRSVRRSLVRYVGRAGAPKGKLEAEQRALLKAMGVRIPRSLR